MTSTVEAVTPVLSVTEVVAGYRGDRVLNGISIAVPQRGVVALLGANGVGKTTLLRAVAGMIPCQRGLISLNGSRIDGKASHHIARLGVTHVPEGRGIFPGLTVRENLDVAQFARGRNADAPILDGLELFPVLGKRINQKAGTLSGGEQQMLAIARALATSPLILLLDEPSLGLAPLMVSKLYEALEIVKQSGAAMLIAEQAVAEALDLADYVYVIGVGGRTLASGEPKKLLSEVDLFQTYMQ